MTYDELLTDIQFWTGADNNEFSKALKTVSLNAWYHKIVTMILESQDEWDFDDPNHADYAILTTDLGANQQDYTIPLNEKVLKIKRIEVSYDGTNWEKATPFDINERSKPTDNSSISDDFKTTEPFYDLRANAIFLYPIPDTVVNDGLKIWWTREIDEFTTADAAQEPGIDEPFHRMLSIGASLDWAVKKGFNNKGDLQNILIDYEKRLKEYYGSKQQDRQKTLAPAYGVSNFK